MTGSTGTDTNPLWRTIWRAVTSTRLATWLLGGVGMLAITGTVLPQLPAAADEAMQVAWFELAKSKYGSAYVVLRSLGLFEVYRSAGFLSLSGALCATTALCTVSRLLTVMRTRLRRVVTLGSVATHLATVTFLVSIVLSQGYAWQESAVTLAAGQSRALNHGTDLILRSDGFDIEYDTHGKPVDYAAQLTLLQDTHQIEGLTIKLNAPLRAAGIGVWLVTYEPAVRLQACGERGQPLALESESGKRNSGDTTVGLGSGQALVRVPDVNLELLISKTNESKAVERYHLEVLYGDTAEPILSQTVPAGQESHVAGLSLTLTPEHYVTYRVKHDPGAAVALLAALVLVLGTSLSLFTTGGHSR